MTTIAALPLAPDRPVVLVVDDDFRVGAMMLRLLSAEGLGGDLALTRSVVRHVGRAPGIRTVLLPDPYLCALAQEGLLVVALAGVASAGSVLAFGVGMQAALLIADVLAGAAALGLHRLMGGGGGWLLRRPRAELPAVVAA